MPLRSNNHLCLRTWDFINFACIFSYKFLPDLNDFGEKTSSFLNRFLLSEKLAHIEVRAAEINALWAVLFALEKDALGKLFKCLLVGLWP